MNLDKINAVKLYLVVFLLIFSAICNGQNPGHQELILEASFAQAIKDPSSGYNLGVYYKTKWPLAFRAGLTHVFTDNDFNRVTARYLQVGYMENKKKWNYHALIGIIPGTRYYILPVYSGGFGYLLNERPRKDYRIVLQLNYAKNRLDDLFWCHVGLHIGFKEHVVVK